MIEARIFKDDIEIGRIQIERVNLTQTDASDYTVRFAVDRIGAVGIHSRLIRAFPRLKYNVLALVLQALNTLDPRELELENGTHTPDMERKVRGIGSAFPRKT